MGPVGSRRVGSPASSRLFAAWQPLWQPFAALLGVAALFLVWWLRQKPSHDRDWDPSVAVLPRAVRDGDAVTIENVRNFEYRSLDDFTPRYETRTFHLANLRGRGHHLLQLGLAVDEPPRPGLRLRARRPRLRLDRGAVPARGRSYSILRSLYRQQELIFLVADERDVILRRTKYGRPQEAHLYRFNATPEELRTAFLDYVAAINSLYETPRWYHGLCANCTTSFYRLPNSRCRCDWRVLANGRLDQALYEAGRLDRSLPFDELRRLAVPQRHRERAPPRTGSGTTSAANWKGAAMSDDIIPLLKVHEYFRGVSDEALQEVVRHARVTHHPAGSVVHEANVAAHHRRLRPPRAAQGRAGRRPRHASRCSA